MLSRERPGELDNVTKSSLMAKNRIITISNCDKPTSVRLIRSVKSKRLTLTERLDSNVVGGSI